MKLSQDLKWRNLINQTTYQDLTVLDQPGIKFYLGVDPSADSMTIGNLAALITAKRMIEAGHKAYLLIGGATGMIGDPDGKKDERVLKDMATIEKNKFAFVRQFKQIFRDQEYMIVDNYDWFKDLGYLEFLRKVGKNVPMSQMMDREFVKSRLGDGGSGISYAEFSYSLIQGYDFVHLNQEHGVTLQFCGADQWGNSIAGVDLNRRINGTETHIMSMPLVINKATGRKFGKTEAGAVWLDETKTSVYQFYQFWLNTDDAGVEDYLKVYTLLPRERIEDVVALQKENPSSRIAQKTLAREVTTLVHGEQRAHSVEKVSNVLFGKTGFDSLNNQDLEMLSKEIPTVSTGHNLIDILVELAIVKSKGEARRMLESGAISINGQKVSQDQLLNQKCLIKKGKNNFVLVF